MLTLLPSSTIFLITLTSGTLICISSPQWLFAWIGLEVNLLSFIPLILQTQIFQETEAAIKYFLVQALGSGLLLLGRLTNLIPQFFLDSINVPSLIILTSLLIKIGAAPLHYWFPGVISSLSWPLCIILTTWQKIAPLLILSLLSAPTTFILPLLAILGAVVGGLGGINQIQIRPLLAYSSVGHIGWILASLWINQSRTILYLSLYITISVALITSLWSSSLFIRNVSNITQLPPLLLLRTIILLLSLGGLPPFLGFFPKWVVLQQLVPGASIRVALLILGGALINLFYYLTIAIFLFLRSPRNLVHRNYSYPSRPLILTLGALTLGASPLLFLIL